MFHKPNFTQVPNSLFDQLLPALKEGELRVLLVFMRQTFGWGNKAWDRISITQLMSKTGMTRDAVCRSTKSLVEKRMVLKHKSGEKGEEESWYSLMVEEPVEFSNPIDDSNNSDQSFKKTPRLFRRPTKETLTKERENTPLPPKRGKRVKVLPSPQIEREKNIFTTEMEHNKLIEKFGTEEKVKRVYEEMALWKDRKGTSRGNDYRTALNWNLTEAKEEKKIDDNLQLVNMIKAKHPDKIQSGEIVIGYKYLEFARIPEAHYKLDNPASVFKEKTMAALRKMGISI